MLFEALLIFTLAKGNVINKIDDVLDLGQVQTQTVIDKTPSFGSLTGSVYDVHMGDTIYGPESYFDLERLLQDATPNDTIIFHLSGYGGDVQGAMTLINEIKTTKAHTVMNVEADCYSAHAYIAVSGNELHMAKFAYLMFHSNSMLGLDCDSKDMKDAEPDRGRSQVYHCKAAKSAAMAENKAFLDQTILTPNEVTFIMSGHDVYLTSDEVNRRLNK